MSLYETKRTRQVFDWQDIRDHHRKNDAWTVIHGNVYDISEFVSRHPGGDVILHCAGHDGTILYESHHSLVDRNMVDTRLSGLQIGTLKGGEVHNVQYDTEFSKDLITACREALARHGRREKEGVIVALSVYAMHVGTYAGLWVFGHTWWGLLLSVAMGGILALEHLIGHAGSHGAISRRGWLTKLNYVFAMLSMESYGMCLRHWTFSHVVSHHGYSYTENDCMLETHLPARFWRLNHSQPWKPLHAFQGYLFRFRSLISFLVSGCRFRVFPFVCAEPLIRAALGTGWIPNPKFMASGSTVDPRLLEASHNGMGPHQFVAFDSVFDELRAHAIANLVWVPLFMHIANERSSSAMWATMILYASFGVQAGLVIQNLLLQHVSEHTVLVQSTSGDWYRQQIEGSVDIYDSWLSTVFTYGVSLQCVHHIFPHLNGTEAIAVRPALEAVCDQHRVLYSYFARTRQAESSALKRMEAFSKNV